MKKTGITTDCVCDLPEEYLKANGIDVMYFYITTDTGRFRDGYAVTSSNILEYLQEGGQKAETAAPDPEEYREFFQNSLKHCDELVHISFTGHIGTSYHSATAALKLMGEDAQRVTIVDSQQLSTGMGYMVMRAVEMRDCGKPAAEIVEAVKGMRDRISTTFITRSAEYLYRNGRLSEKVEKLCRIFMLHPVLTLRDGRITLKSLRVGNYEAAVMRYIRSQLRHSRKIDKRRLFITHAGCPVKMIAEIKAQTQKLCAFEEVIVTRASATVSSNCGPGTVGVLFMNH